MSNENTLNSRVQPGIMKSITCASVFLFAISHFRYNILSALAKLAMAF